jgi:hypothetical protein
MGHSKFGNLTRHAAWDPRGERMRCIRCGVPIMFGQHCQECGRVLRQRGRRQRRKPR